MHKILIIDDEAKIRKNIREILSLNGYLAVEAAGGEEAIEQFRRERPSSVLLDLGMPGMDGVEALRRLLEIDPTVPVIIVTGNADIPAAVNAIKQGAYDFLTKPVNFGHLLLTLNHAVARASLEKTVRELDSTLTTSLEAALGPSEAMKKVVNQVRRVAASDLSVLIQGETGTGKTYLANLIHSISRRASKPFVKVSIGSLQETVVESELFGCEKGAFTGADRTRKGFFETAEGGTLLIDDLDNISPLVQGKLLSIIEDKRLQRVGSAVPIPLDFRIIGASNADILKLVTTKQFREDLFFRLTEVTLRLPPLRERKDDIVFFAEKFLRESRAELNSPACIFADGTMDLLQRSPWPGNLRQLKNVMNRTALYAQDGVITPEDVEACLSGETGQRDGVPVRDAAVMTMKDAEKMAIQNALAATKGQKLKAASLLQIDYKTLVRKMREYLIE
jgi:DNA-binding NtrC family response regulator